MSLCVLEDQSDMYTFIMEELACTLADGGLGHITDSDREVALSTQR